MTITLARTFQFDAAHRNSSAPPDDPRARVHGHTYEVELRLTGEIDPAKGWLIDFGEMKDAGRDVIDRLDHYCLNDVEGLRDTTLPDIAEWITRHLRGTLPGDLSAVVRIVGATALEARATTSAAAARIAFGFAAAHFLPRLPESHKCRRLHGHSFGIEVVGSDPQVVIKHIGELYPTVDHRLLNEIPGLDNPTSELLAEWLWNRLADDVDLDEIVVSETCTTRCIFRPR